MPIDVSVHALGIPVQGNHPPAPPMPPLQNIVALAEAADSAEITAPATGAVLRCSATVKLRAAVLKASDLDGSYSGAPDAAGSAFVIEAGQTALMTITKGKWKLRTALY